MEKLFNYYEYALQAKPSHPIELDSAKFICEWINNNYIFRMLEIGSGVGFSANYFAINSQLTSIVSLEKQFGFYLECKKRSMSEKIEFVWKDFFEYESYTKFPLIFLDASKSKQIDLFERAQKFLKKEGTIIVDNIFLKRLQKKDDKKSLKLLEKAKKFENYLNSLENFNIKIIDIGDGIAICQKKD